MTVRDVIIYGLLVLIIASVQTAKRTGGRSQRAQRVLGVFAAPLVILGVGNYLVSG